MISMRRAIASALVLGSAVLAAQTPATPQFRSGVDLVHLDVSVLDRNRRPVKGLTAHDFTILEDGRPQPVAAFSAIDLPDPVPPSTPWMRDVAPDVRRNTELAERRLVIIVMDDAMIPFDIAMIRSAREIGRLVVEKLGPNDLASVVFTRDNRNSQEFTSDRARLLKAIDSFEHGGRNVGLPPETREVPALAVAESPAFFASVGTIRRVAETLAVLPQRRKAVVYVTVGVPASLEAAAEVVMAGGNTRGGTEIGAMMRQVMDHMSATYRQAQLANVNIYPVSPAGVGGMEALAQSERWKNRYVPAYETGANYLDFLVGMAENTGGRAFPERNQFASALDQVFLENGSYYLLGFSPAKPAADGKHHRLEVKVNRSDVEVRTRSGYYNEKPKESKGAAEVTPLTAALSGLLPKTDVALEATAAPFAVPGKPEAGIVVVLTVHDQAPARSARTKQKVDVQVSAFTQEGAPRGAVRYETDVTLRPGPAGAIEFEILSGLALRPGRYQLRLSAHLGADNKTGSVYYDLEVPDFTARPLSMSGLLLTADPKPVSTDTERIKAWVPLAPTARRTFAPEDRVTAFARIYQGGQTSAAVPDTVRPGRQMPGRDALQAAQLMISITDAQGTVRDRRTEAMAPDMFGVNDRMAEFRMVLPLKGLSAGDYLLTLEATSPRGSARRDVRFSIR
jgi:VWFA-related protein